MSNYSPRSAITSKITRSFADLHNLEGARCPNCQGSGDVLESRPKHRGIIVRRRQCKECKRRYTTYELGAESLLEFVQAAEKIRSAAADMKEISTRLAEAASILNPELLEQQRQKEQEQLQEAEEGYEHLIDEVRNILAASRAEL